MTFLFLLLYNYIHTKEVIKIIYFNNHDIILKEKEKINDLISIQQNFSKLLLGYIEKIMDNILQRLALRAEELSSNRIMMNYISEITYVRIIM